MSQCSKKEAAKSEQTEKGHSMCKDPEGGGWAGVTY